LVLENHHLSAFFLLTLHMIYHALKSLLKKSNCSKKSRICSIMIDDSNDAYLNALPAGAMFIYVVGIFRILSTFNSCVKQESTTSLKEWIKVEAVIFNIILLATTIYCLLYKLMKVLKHEMF